MLGVLLNVLLTLLHIRAKTGVLRRKLARPPASFHDERTVGSASVRPPVLRDARTALASEADRHACAREAVAAIEAVLKQRCPDLKHAFWSAVEKHYRPGTEPSRRLPAR